ncbi:MAG: hypothetical protein NW226_27475 [Microscillaceae bacterium]|nr:hypothetical protein [Microscillaceae bacterium]
MKKSIKVLFAVIVFTVFVLNLQVSLETVGDTNVPVLRVQEAMASAMVCNHNASPKVGNRTTFCAGTVCKELFNMQGSAIHYCGSFTPPPPH